MKFPVYFIVSSSDLENVSDCYMSDQNSTMSYESSLVEDPKSDMIWFSDSEDQDNEWGLVTIGIENADPVCVRQDKISKGRIFYKYIKDVVEFYYDGRHEYDTDVVEFFDLCGPMFFGVMWLFS